MLINQKSENQASHVEFVAYTGKWPCLCNGVLTLKIDGIDYTFGYGRQYPKFWRSGGECTMHEIVAGEWIIDVSELPEKFQKYAAEIDDVVNRNIEHGCCGGCR